MYEVELKVELTEEERAQLVSFLHQAGFSEKEAVTQHDYYVNIVKSPYGGYDLKRYRDENGTLIYTEKVWEISNGTKMRREDEHEVSGAEFDSAIATAAEGHCLKKERVSFTGNYQGTEIKIDFDSIKFDHSPALRYFVEAEIIVAEKDAVRSTKEIVSAFLKEALHKTEIIESPGMVSMMLEKK